MNGRMTLFALASLIAWPFGLLALPRQPLPPLPEWALARWSFDEALRQYPFNAAPAAISEASLVESWSGYALNRVGERVTPFVLPEVAAPHQINFTPESGAIRVWFKPAWGSPDAGCRGSGSYARLLELVSLGGDRSTPVVQWSLYATPDGSALYVSGQGAEGPRDYLRAAIKWPADTWHLVLLAYTPTNSALYLDGELAAFGDPLPVPGVPTAPTLALVVGSDITGAFPAQGDFDELTTFNREPDSQHITWYYQAYARRAAQGPVTEAEILAAQALRAAFAQQRAMQTALQGGGAQMSMMMVGGTSLCITNIPVFITNVVSTWVTNQGWTVTFDVQGGTNGLIYDIFTTTALAGNSITNVQWTWLEQGPTCSTYQYTNQTTERAFYILGTPLDSDGDGIRDAFERLITHTDPNASDVPTILTQPLSQTVDSGDTVTFTVVAQAASPLRYQWLREGMPLSGETNRFLALTAVRQSQADNYSVEVTSAAGLSVLSSNATLTVQNADYWPIIQLTGARQDYTFKNGVTYFIGSRVELYGSTTIEGGAVIKPAWFRSDATLAVMGILDCKTDDPYLPAYLTSLYDDTVGEHFPSSLGDPVTADNGAPYLDLSQCLDVNPTLNNLHMRYADLSVTAPAGKALTVWNCQFVECATGFVADAGATVSLHNVLFADCGSVVAGVTNFAAVIGEQVTADVSNFWLQSPPASIALTNSIVSGIVANGPTLVQNHTAINPTGPIFQPTGAGHYYLTNSSPYRQAGDTNISPRLLAELHQKTTQAPMVLRPKMQITGDLTLGPQVARYTSGPPDYGYHYPALDYTVAWVINRGTITVLPGTVVGLRNERLVSNGLLTFTGFDLWAGSRFIGRGSPSKPITFVNVQSVQEQTEMPCFATFVPDFWPNDEGLNAPSMDLRFTHLYAHSSWYHVWAGHAEYYQEAATSPSGLVNWMMQDCSVQGGRINLGTPDNTMAFDIPWQYYYGSGSVSWVNNLFDNVAINLDPSFYWADQTTINCDMQVSAWNNLFRNSLWFHLGPIPATTGNWTFRDNFFDKVNFLHGTNSPMDFDHNGYWPCSVAEQQLAWSQCDWVNNFFDRSATYASQLSMAPGSNGGTNELVLAVVPSYETGPFGHFYLPATQMLYHAGSRTAAEAGLYQYTIQISQTKEGDETPSGHPVSIGLHYVATSNANSTLPNDSDTDGIPDYVEDHDGNGEVNENETSPVLTETVIGVNDPVSPIYDDIDLSGNGLVGRIKKALQLGALETNNPLQGTQLITGEEPSFVTFEIPISYNVLTNVGTLRLSLTGIEATFNSFVPATNGNCLLLWETAFDPPGQHYLQAKVALNSGGPDARVLEGVGLIRPFHSANVLQFSERGSMFDSTSAYLDAKLAAPEANYTIELYDPSTAPPTLIKTITNSTSNGLIEEEWNLEYAGGTNVFIGECVEAVFNVALTGVAQNAPAAGSAKKVLHRITGAFTEWGPNMDVVYMYTPRTGALASAFSQSGIFWNTMLSVVDVLTKPAWSYDVYNSYFNRYTHTSWQPYPGYVTSRSNVTTTLFSDLTNGITKQLYCYSHGSSTKMFNASEDVYFTAPEVGTLLGNVYKPRGGLTTKNPYRFVFLDACSTASTDWRRAFGIFPIDVSRNKVGPQAFVGWADTIISYPTLNADCAEAYATTLNRFYTSWMSGLPLAECIRLASDGNQNPCPFPVATNDLFVVKGVIYVNKPGLNADICVMGHSGLKVDGLNPAFDNQYASRKTK